MHTRSIALGAVLGLSLVACGSASSSPTPAPTPVATLAPTPTVAPTPTATVAPTSTTAPPASPAPSVVLPHGAADLEALLPSSFQGQPLFVVSLGHAELAASPAGPPIFAMVDAAGGDSTQTGFAIANNPPTVTFNLLALAAPGGDGQALADAYAAAAIAGGESVSSADATLGGRSVTRVVSVATNPLGDIWIYAVDDVMFGIQSNDEALAAQLIALLP